MNDALLRDLMSLLDDLTEVAHASGLVARAWLDPDGCDAYELRAAPRPITVRVRPDGRFSGAVAGRPA
jgi:hypothetical protein